MSDPERWARVTDLFHQALDLPAGERAAWLAHAAAAEAALAAEVTSLLEAHGRAGHFLDRLGPSIVTSDGPTATPALALAPGRMVGAYRITRPIGAGGMGEVYLAEDTRLGRPVALKALAAAFTADPGRRERLRREARAAGALAHPGIATVYALEDIDGQLYIASEFVEGPTLRDALSAGPLPLARTLAIGAAIANALAAAHAKGIVHRDLKPENVILTTTGIKILDFGLARVDGPSPQPGLTAEGAAIGTPAYMSPEQIRGEGVDARSDLFALGVVLYETASGRNPFRGADAPASLARVLELEVPELPADGWPPADAANGRALDAIARRCLRKSPADRFQSAADVAAALERIRLGQPSVPTHALPDADMVDTGRRLRAHLWWQFHQGTTAVTYAALFVALWLAHRALPAPWGTALFILGLIGGSTAGTLRLHLWFTAREYPAEWSRQHGGLRRWMRVGDVMFATTLLLVGVGAFSARPALGPFLVVSSVAVWLAALVIEPATTRAAFGDP